MSSDRLLLRALCCSLLSLLPACAPDANSDDDSNAIVVGALLPFTGDRSATGANYEKALILATEQINRAGGIAGHPVKLVSKDTHSDVSRGLQSTQALLDLGVSGIIGPDEPELALSMAPLLGADPVTQILASIASPSREAGRVPDANWFHIAPNSGALGCTLGTRIYNDAFGRVVVLNQDDLFFSEMASSVLARYNVLLNPVVDSKRVAASAASFSSTESSYGKLVASTLAQNPDTLVLLTNPVSAAEIVSAFAVSGKVPHWYLAPMLQTDAFLQNCPAGALDGSLGIGAALPDDHSFAAQFSERWSGEQPAIPSYFYYDALILWALAMQAAYQEAGGRPSNSLVQAQVTEVSRAGSNAVSWDGVKSGLALIASGQKINYRGASGKLDLDPDGELSADSLARFWAVQKSQIIQNTFGVCQPLSGK